jgi:hypothetical protein
MNISDVPDYARDAFYVTVGLGVLATRNIQERQQTWTTEIEARVRPLLDQLTANLPAVTAPTITIRRPERLGALDHNLDLGNLRNLDLDAITGAIEKVNERLEERTQQLDQRFAELESRVDGVLDRLEDQLPDAAREVVSQARGVAKEARGQLRTMVTRAA